MIQQHRPPVILSMADLKAAPIRYGRIFLMTFGIIFLMKAIAVAPLTFSRQTVIVTISDIHAPRECRKRRDLVQGARWRSGDGVLGHYCGLVFSDHGSFKLPQSERIRFFGVSREELHDTLVIGCSYEIVAAGYGPLLEEGRPASTGQNRTLLRATLAGPCQSVET